MSNVRQRRKHRPRIELVCVGTELLTGALNTHASFIGQRLLSAGFSLSQEHTVGDEEIAMRVVFAEALRRSDVVLTSGGLGPTFDDLTREAWSRATRRPLRLDNKIVQSIRLKFKSRGIKMPPSNAKQGYLLKGARIIENHFGTAPGQLLRFGRKLIVLMPGPPRELYPMFENVVLPEIQKWYSRAVFESKTLKVVGLAESIVDDRIRPLVSSLQSSRGCRITYGILASRSVIDVKFMVEGRDGSRVKGVVDDLENRFRKLLGASVFGEGEDTLAGAIGRLFLENNKTLAVAESCTGGLLAKMITDSPGASRYFTEGLITYSNVSKSRVLGVKTASLDRYGAVSNPVALEMAAGLKRKSGADYALSITGIAGPAGGTINKPVGLVFIGCATPRKCFARKFRFSGDRDWVRHRSAIAALDLLRHQLR